ncbi:MAG: hypothetical protein JNL79_25635 [Myxococcales bacterium]|nr:hypothetical protein [Myxococcales bacterium]
MRLDLAPLGVAWFDKNLGGVPVQEPTVVLGPPKSGKTCLTLGFLLRSLEDAPAMLVTDDAPEAVIDLCSSFLERDLRPFLRSKRLTILSYGHSFADELQGSGGAGAPLAEIGSLARKRGIGAIAFDTFDPVVLAPDAASARAFVRGVVAALSHLAIPTLLTARADAKGRSPALQELVARAAASLELEVDRKGRKIRIAHATWCSLQDVEMRVDFVQRQGIVVREETVVLPKSKSGEHRFDGLLTYDSLPAVRPTLDSRPPISAGANGITSSLDSDDLERVSVRSLVASSISSGDQHRAVQAPILGAPNGPLGPRAHAFETLRSEHPDQVPARPPSEPPRTGGALYPHQLPPNVPVPQKPTLPGFKRPELPGEHAVAVAETPLDPSEEPTRVNRR